MFNSPNPTLLHRQKKNNWKGSIKRKKNISRSSKEKSISREYRSSHGDSSVTERIITDWVEMDAVTERQLCYLETNERWQGYKPEEVKPIGKDLKLDSTAITRLGELTFITGKWILKYMIIFWKLEIKSGIEYCHSLIKTISTNKNP